MSKPTLKVQKSDKQIKQEIQQTKLQELADKRATNKLTLEDIFDQGKIIIEMLQAAK